jgi:tRNA uridine 5-carbamoylmethylation protein Kti12
MKNKKNAIFNNVFYNNILGKIIEKYDTDEMTEKLENLIYVVLQEEGYEDEIDDFIKYMPSWFSTQLNDMYKDDN